MTRAATRHLAHDDAVTSYPTTPYYVVSLPQQAEVRWRSSGNLAALFRRSDLNDADDRAQAIADELNDRSTL